VAASQALFGGAASRTWTRPPWRRRWRAAAGGGGRPCGCESLPPLVELLADSGLCASRSAARRAIAEGGAYVNNTRIADEGQVPGEGDLLAGRWLVLRRGKRHLARRPVTADSILRSAPRRMLYRSVWPAARFDAAAAAS
jgi:tyrosyl-tRNA synthetase